MKKIIFFSAIVLCLSLSACTAHYPENLPIRTDTYSQHKIASIIEHQVLPLRNSAVGERISQISARFLETPYVADTLIGSQTTPEKLVIDLAGVDCFTLIDYVYALRDAASSEAFYAELIKTRYTDGKINFVKRKHFFTDWAALPHINAKDITLQVSANAQQTLKYLNQKADGSEYLPGVGIRQRVISWIPGKSINQQVINKLKTGDFIGLYTPLAGLDVTHVGIFIASDTGPMLRNASSLKKNMKVVDSPFLDYVKDKPGIIVLRAEK